MHRRLAAECAMFRFLPLAWRCVSARLRTAALVFAVAPFSPLAHAAWCGMMPNYPEGPDIDISMGRISVSPGVAVGEVFHTREFPIGQSYYGIVSCKAGDYTNWRVMQGTATSFANVYTTNIEGVGMRTSWVPAGSTTHYYAGGQTTWRFGMAGVSGTPGGTAMITVSGSVVVELVKIGAKVGSGALAGGTYTWNVAQPAFPFNAGTFLSTHIAGGGSQIVPETGTCSIGNLQVPMDPVPVGRFHGMGSTSGETSFPVQFSCSGANGAVTLTLDADRLNADGSLGLLKPQSGGGSASCIALQILDGGTRQPVVLGKKNVVGTVLNTSASFNLPYLVRYYQSGGGSSCVSPGLVKGTATVTVSYQ